MKVLIWVACIFACAAIIAACRMNGIILGGVPSALLVFAAIGGAHALCTMRDRRRYEKWNQEKK